MAFQCPHVGTGPRKSMDTKSDSPLFRLSRRDRLASSSAVTDLLCLRSHRLVRSGTRSLHSNAILSML